MKDTSFLKTNAGLGIFLDDVAQSRIDAVDTALKADPQLIHTQDGQGHKQQSLLHLAARSDNSELVFYLATRLKEQSKSVDLRDAQDRSPLMIASQEGRLDTAMTLCRLGADVNACAKQSDTPLILAIKGRNQEDVKPRALRDFDSMISMLISYGAKVDSKTIAMAENFSDHKTLARLTEKQAMPLTNVPSAGAVPKKAPTPKL